MNPLHSEAQELLDENWTGRYTRPSPELYPHQWNWDSCLVALGNALVAPERAARELASLLDGQWETGMVPHIVFQPQAESPEPVAGYFPGPQVYDVTRSQSAPKEVATSGLTQPPLLATALDRLHRVAPDEPGVRRVVEKGVRAAEAWHAHLLDVRDPEGMGAVTILHPWESGMDNLPVWDGPLERAPAASGSYQRVDLEAVKDPVERPSDREYDRYVGLIEQLKDADWNHVAAYPDHAFRVKDLVTTSLLYADAQALRALLDDLGRSTAETDARLERLREGFGETFVPGGPDGAQAYCYDLLGEEHIRVPTAASLLPVYAGLVDPDDMSQVLSLLRGHRFCGTACHVTALPSTSTASTSFSAAAYWRGPVWFNVNWMVIQGLASYGYQQQASRIREGLLHLVDHHGFWEYFDPYTGQGLGAGRFSWTASLTLDLLAGDPDPLPRGPANLRPVERRGLS